MRNFMAAQKVRSGPVYVETERGTISLVFEANAAGSNGLALRPAGKADVYVIDDAGVRLVRRRNRLLLALAIAVVACCLMLVISQLFRNRGRLS